VNDGPFKLIENPLRPSDARIAGPYSIEWQPVLSSHSADIDDGAMLVSCMGKDDGNMKTLRPFRATLELTICLILFLLMPFMATAAEQTDISLNKASTLQLAMLPGISPELARAFIDYRAKAGPFKTPEDLLKVPGMTKEILAMIAPRIDAKGDLICSIPEDQEVKEEFKMPAY
jgi:competence protein ComEA